MLQSQQRQTMVNFFLIIPLDHFIPQILDSKIANEALNPRKSTVSTIDNTVLKTKQR
jgi:hypothetical protein